MIAICSFSRLRPAFCRSLALLIVVFLGIGSSLAEAPIDSEARFAQARRLANEGSWALARDAYAAALALAPAAEARRWGELGLLEATWQAETPPAAWNGREAWVKNHADKYQAMGKPYLEGELRDDFWMAWQGSLARFREKQGGGEDPMLLRAEIADYLGAKLPTEASAAVYVGFLQQALPFAVNLENRHLPRFLPHLLRGMKVGVDAADRAWCAWYFTRLRQVEKLSTLELAAHLQARAERWGTAIAMARGTRWATAVAAEDFLWKANLGWSSQDQPGELADIRALLAEAARLRSEIKKNLEKELAEPLVQQLQRLEHLLGDPQLNVQMATQFMPGAPVKFAYGTTGFGRLSLTLKRREPADWARLNINDSEKMVSDQTLRNWAIVLPGAEQRVWHSEVIDLGAALPPGFYSLLLRAEEPAAGEPIFQHQDFIVSGIRGVGLVADGGAGELFVYAATDGQPVRGVQARGLVATMEDKNVRLTDWQGATNEQGRLMISLPTRHWQLLAGMVGGQPVWFAHYQSSPNEDRLVVDAFVERPLYRPGETAHWKIVVRERKNGRFTVPDSTRKLRLKVELGDETLVPEAALQLNALGTAHGEMVIPAQARPGQVTLTLMEQDDSEHCHALFLVDNFVPPAVTAKVELASGTDSLRPGQEMVVRVTANYFSGGPVTGAPVECRFWADRLFLGGLPSDGFPGWRDELRNNVQRARTGADGAAEFRLLLPAGCTENAAIKCEAGVMPEGLPPAQASVDYRVTAAGFMLDPTGWTKPRLVRPGEEVAFSALVRNGANLPAAFKGEVQLIEKKWAEAWLGPQAQVVTGEAFRKIFQEMAAKQKAQGFAVGAVAHGMSGWKRIHGEIEEIKVTESGVEAGPDGRIAARFRLPHDGIYELRVTRSEVPLSVDRSRGDGSDDASDYFRFERGGFTHTNTGGWAPSGFVLVAADEHTPEFSGPPEAADLAWPENPDPQAGLTVLALVPEGTTQAWLSVGAEQEVVSTPIALQGRLGYCVIDYPPAFYGMGQATLSYVSSEYGSVQSISDTFKVSDESMRLQVTVTPDAMVRKPGEPAKVNLAVTDRRGRPRQAELAVAVADEAVVSLVDHRPSEDTPLFLLTSFHQRVQPQAFGWVQVRDLQKIGDLRPGVRLNAYTGYFGEEETLVLSPFTVESAEDGGYSASMTLAGTRIRTDLKDVGSSISVVTRQFLQDTGATNRSDLLVYTSATEVGGAGGNFSAEAPRPIVVRTHFSSAALWAPEVVTDKEGHAEVSFKYPDNLTQWRIAAYATGEASTFGRASVLTQTSLPLQARLGLPRFLVAGDTAGISATLVNRTGNALNAMAELKVAGAVAPVDAAGLKRQGVNVPAQAEARVTWDLAARQAGQAEFSLAAVSGPEADAMILSLPVLEDGIQQETAVTGRLAPAADRLQLTLPLPAVLDRARTHVTLQLSPSYAATMLDALPYLIDYPYGCVEQTMSRFLPAVVVRKTLVDLGLEAGAVEQRILAGESAADAKRRTKTAGLGKLDEVVALSLDRLSLAQSSQGGFGWWPGAQSMDLWMTAYVAWGLDLAVKAEVGIPEELAENTFEALPKAILAEGTLDDRLAFALSVQARLSGGTPAGAMPEIRKRFSDLYAARDKLSASGRASLALAAGAFGTADQRGVLLRNLENGAQRVKANDFGDTVHWGATKDYWRAMDGAVETTALTLFALLELEPRHPLIEPAVNWLVLNRRSSHWASTRDTAFSILALNQYLQQRKEIEGDREVEVLANGTSVQRFKITRDALLAGSLNLAIPAPALRAGDNQLELRRVSGAGPVYAVALGSAWAVGDAVKPAASLMGVARAFERNKAQPTLFGTLRITPQPLPSGGSVLLGEQVTARVTLQVPNELEYLMIEVPKPAGCEPLNPLSGWDAQLVRVEETAGDSPKLPMPGRPIYREERDDKSVFFLDRVEAGTWEIRFGLRAATGGNFRALPVAATAMYVPEVRANSDTRRVEIKSTDLVDQTAADGK